MEAFQLQRGLRVLPDEGDLEKRIAASIAARRKLLDQPLEGQVLVRVRVQRALADSREQLAEIRFPRKARSQNQRVQKGAQHSVELGARAPGNLGAHGHVLRARIAMEQDQERRQPRHERRRSLGTAQCRHPLDQLGPQRHDEPPAAVTLHARTRAIGRQLQRPDVLQRLAPEAELPLPFLAREPRALPQRVVRVLPCRGCNDRYLAVHPRRVLARELGLEYLDRPAIGDDVMPHLQQHVLVACEPDEAKSRQRRDVERERELSLELDPFQERALLLCRRRGRDVDTLEVESRRRMDDLPRLVIDQRERGSQDFVPFDDGEKALPQRGRVDAAREPMRIREVVGAAAFVETLHEPHPRLRMRQGQRLATRARPQHCLVGLRSAGAGLPRSVARCGTHRFDDARHAGDGRPALEQRLDRQVDAEALLDVADQMDPGQRISAEEEEVVVAADRDIAATATTRVPRARLRSATAEPVARRRSPLRGAATSCAGASHSASAFRCNLPPRVRGSRSTKYTRRGALRAPVRARTCSITRASSTVAFVFAHDGGDDLLAEARVRNRRRQPPP